MILALVNEKGGVGKTTIAVHLVAWLRASGVDAALVDADVQNASSIWTAELDKETPIYRFQSEVELRAGLPELEHDVIVVDGPAGLRQESRTVLLFADLVLIPCGPSVLDLRASDQGIAALGEVRSFRGGLPQAILVPNKLQKNYGLSRQLLTTASNLDVDVGPGLGLRQAYPRSAQESTVVWNMDRSAADATHELVRLFHYISKYIKTNAKSVDG
ncbi:MAG: chromosome partitioning protein [Verrucomicrobiales bacterium]|jgi:chromosome partitioning protein